MSEKKLVEAIGNVDDKYVNEAMNVRVRRKNVFGRVSAFAATAAAACFVMIFGISALVGANKADSVVAIDVNPSIELTVSKNDKVLEAKALNADAEVVLADLSLEKVELDTALNAIVGSLLQNGYLDEVSNAVNVCVANDDEKRADELGQKVSGELNSIFVAKDLIGQVSTQSVGNDAVANYQGKSFGKATLAEEVAQNMGITVDEALELSVSELWALSDTSGQEFITKQEALEIVIKDAEIKEDEITEMKIKIEHAGGVFKYDIKIKVGERKEYKYKLDAVTGDILEYEFKLHPEKPEPADPVDQITKNEALAIAYADAGVESTKVVLTELKHRPAEKEYHISFYDAKYDYFYVIDAVEGKVVTKDVIERPAADEEVPVAKVTFEQALKLALDMAGVKFEDLTMCDVKYHVHKHGEVHYRIHFHVDKMHYEYVVDALTGECTEKKRHEHPTPPHEKEEPKKPEAPKKPEPKPEPEKPAKPEPKPEPEKPAKPEPKPEPEKPAKPEPKPEPSEDPSEESTEAPSEESTETPSEEPSEAPSETPEPSEEPSEESAPAQEPAKKPAAPGPKKGAK